MTSYAPLRLCARVHGRMCGPMPQGLPHRMPPRKGFLTGCSKTWKTHFTHMYLSSDPLKGGQSALPPFQRGGGHEAAAADVAFGSEEVEEEGEGQASKEYRGQRVAGVSN